MSDGTRNFLGYILPSRSRVINEALTAMHAIEDIAVLGTMTIIPRLTILQGYLDHQLLSPRGVGISADIPTA
jgi:hypothetical protein